MLKTRFQRKIQVFLLFSINTVLQNNFSKMVIIYKLSWQAIVHHHCQLPDIKIVVIFYQGQAGGVPVADFSSAHT